MLASAGIRGDVTLRPYLFVTDEERARWRYFDGCIVIQSSGLDAVRPMRTKEYFPDRFQVVIDRLRNRHRIVQIGSPKDPIITGATDLRGRTPLRDTAAVLANARMFIGLEGAMMHLARAVDCPAVIVQGGHTSAEQFGYPCNIQLVRRPECSPCWRYNGCDHDFVCMRDISADEVYAACEALLARPRENVLSATRGEIRDDDAAAWLATLRIDAR
jgi:ADP-heptose:LPS heptosyltransferase